jgi:regulator of sigma E protease
VLAGSPAEAAGIRSGDLIVAIDGTPIATFPDLQRIVGASGGKALSVVVERGGARVAIPVTPQVVRDPQGAEPPRATLGVRGTLQPEDPATALWLGVKETGNIIAQTMSFLGRLVAGEESAKEIGGPIKIAQASSQVFKSSGVGGLVTLAALLSVSIGLLNLFPIPLLDGGHLVFYAVEAIRGRPLTEVTQERLFRFGFAVVLMLMLFAIWNDLVHPFTG